MEIPVKYKGVWWTWANDTLYKAVDYEGPYERVYWPDERDLSSQETSHLRDPNQ